MNQFRAISLTAKAPFDFQQSLKFVKRFCNSAGSSAVDGDALLHAAIFNGKALVVAIRTADEPNELHVEVVGGDEPSKLDTQRIADYLTDYLSLNDDLTHFYSVASKDRRFKLVLEKLFGYHQARFPTPLESAVWAILSQGTPQVLARKLMANVAGRYGQVVSIHDVGLQAFPEPATFINAPTGELRDLIASERKAVSIKAAATAFAGVERSWLAEAPYEFVESWLREIPGIGEWSASLIMLRGLGRMESFSLNSPASVDPILIAARRVYGYHYDAKRLAATLEKYGESGGYWLHYLRAGVGR